MTNWAERAFDVVVDITKQVLTLSTGVVALSVTFLTDVASDASAAARFVLASSWISFILAVALGIMTLMAAAGVQREAGADGAPEPSIDAPNLRLLGAWQLIAFALGLLLMLVAGIMSF